MTDIDIDIHSNDFDLQIFPYIINGRIDVIEHVVGDGDNEYQLFMIAGLTGKCGNERVVQWFLDNHKNTIYIKHIENIAKAHANKNVLEMLNVSTEGVRDDIPNALRTGFFS